MRRDLLARLSPDLHWQNPENWPPVAEELIDKKLLKLYRQRKQAVIKYCKCEWTLKTIENKFGFKRKYFLNLIKRCLTQTKEGDIVGFAGLIPYKRISGRKGKLRELFERFPEVEAYVEKLYCGKKLKDQIPEKKAPIYTVHQKFLEKCSELGVGPHEFPFNSKTQGREPLRVYLNALYNENVDNAVASRSGKIAQRNLVATDIREYKKRPVKRPYEVVQADAHQLHASVTILAEDPNGIVTPLPLQRPWLIFLIEKLTRAILGYFVSLNAEPSSVDLLEATAHALTPWKPKELTISGLEYPEGGGLPSGVLPQCAWRVFDRLELDNAMAHISPWVHERINLVTQCCINLGKSRTPEGRAILERFFLTLENKGFHRLPSTTGSHPKDPRRRDPVEKAKHYRITLSEIEQLLDVIVAKYNCTPSKSIYGRTPLDYINSFDEQKPIPIRTVIDAHRKELPLFIQYYKVTVRGNAKLGKRPYVQFKHAIYRNEALIASSSIIGTQLTLAVYTMDISSIRAYLPDGSTLGLLQAQGRWALKPHSLKTREIICKLINEGLISRDSQDPVSDYHKFKYQQSRKSAKAASALTKALKESGDMIVANSESLDERSSSRKLENNWQPRQKNWITLTKTKRR